jgi:hypothetical protein
MPPDSYSYYHPARGRLAVRAAGTSGHAAMTVAFLVAEEKVTACGLALIRVADGRQVRASAIARAWLTLRIDAGVRAPRYSPSSSFPSCSMQSALA